MWFQKLTGFKEVSPEQVRANIEIKDDKLISKLNGAGYAYGKLEVPTLEELRDQYKLTEEPISKIQVSEVVGNVQTLHKDEANKGALFQVASQFNLLEMISPNRTPESGVGIYEYDGTQGPACAVACGAGTIYRNYFAPTNGHIGQTSTNQIDCLKEIGIALGNDRFNLWEMKNGYALLTRDGLKNISNQIKSKTEKEYEVLKGILKIGVQWDSEVTISENGHQVSQAYCSALPVAYSRIETELWEDFARIILEATYEATFYAALKNYKRNANNKVFLTLVGGGAFGNETNWIFDAIKHSINKFSNIPLDVKIVSYGSSKPGVRQLIDSIELW